MGVYIKGMEMPKSCMLCPLCVEEADPANGEMCMVTGTLMPPCTRERLDNCPLTPVPPHGDLIDRRYAIATACSGRIRTLPTTEDGENWIRVEEVRESIKNAPTIIPAEEEKV